MSTNPTDFRVEIIKARPQGLATFDLGAPVAGEVLDVTEHVELDGLSAVNRALERDLDSFKTGDVTVTFDNPDGYFTDLFDPVVFTQATIWSLRIFRRGEVQFWGALIGIGSVKLNKKDRQCEVTAYGLSKLLDRTSGELVKRIFLAAGYKLNGVHGPGSTTLTLSSGAADFARGDVLHLRNAANSNSEDVTVKYVISSTQVRLEAPTVNGYANADPVDITTEFYRYRTIAFLVEQIFNAAGVASSTLVSNSQFGELGPTHIAYDGLGTTAALVSSGAERNGRIYATLAGDGTYYQTIGRPDQAWTKEDATLRPWIDWSRYKKQSETPSSVIRHPDNYGGGIGREEWHCGVDDGVTVPAWKILYRANFDGLGQLEIQLNVSTDGGLTFPFGWSNYATYGVYPGFSVYSCDYDPVRDQVWVTLQSGGGGYDILVYHAGVWTVVVAGGAAASTGTALRYIPDRDYLLASYEDATGHRRFVAYRDKAILWDRDPGLPRYIRHGSRITGADTIEMTWGARYVNGAVYMTALYDKAGCLISSSDDFVTAWIRKVQPGSSFVGQAMPARVNGALYFWFYTSSAAIDRSYWIAAPFWGGVIDYADFEGISCAEALKKLAVLANALFWVDDDLQGHFVARDLYDSGAVTDIEDRLMEETDDLIWDETAQYVKVSGGGHEATAGDAGFASEGIDLESAFIPCDAFAQALADAVYDFYSARRAMVEATVVDPDGRIYRPLDRVMLGGAERYLVYESDHDLASDEVRLTLLEDR